MLPAEEFHGAPRVSRLITKCFYLVIRRIWPARTKNTSSWRVMTRRDLHWPSTREENSLHSPRLSLADGVGVGPQGEKSRPVFVQQFPGWVERRTRQPRSTHPRVILDSGCPREAGVGLADRLVGQPIPPVSLDCYQGRPVDLETYANGFSLVLYLYPGSTSSAEGGPDARVTDALQHRAFRERLSDFIAREYRVIGISSQSEHEQAQAVMTHDLKWPHRLLSDSELRLASAFDLPTFTLDGARLYQRIVLVVSRGRISKAFFPISSGARSAVQVLAWMQLAADGPPLSIGSPPDVS
jgi:peroxiredoxin